MRKLSKPMTDMIHGATFYTARHDGQIIRSGYVIAGATNTVVALIDRGLATTSDAANLGMNWLTEGVDGGEAKRAELLGADVPVLSEADVEDIAADINAEADHWADVAYADARIAEGAELDAAAERGGFDVYVTDELPGDAERIWDAENAAAERASYESEQDSEDDCDIDDMIAARDQAAFEALISDTSWMTDPVIVSDAGLTRLMKALDFERRQRRARKVRVKPSVRSRRPSKRR